MKKVFLYAFAAVVLGVGIMLFPQWIYFRSVNEEGPIGFKDSTPYFKPMTASENLQAYMKARTEQIPTYDETLGGSNVQPQLQTRSSYASLQMLAIGFIAAMIVYFIVKRRLRRPMYLSTYRFPPC